MLKTLMIVSLLSTFGLVGATVAVDALAPEAEEPTMEDLVEQCLAGTAGGLCCEENEPLGDCAVRVPIDLFKGLKYETWLICVDGAGLSESLCNMIVCDNVYTCEELEKCEGEENLVLEARDDVREVASEAGDQRDAMHEGTTTASVMPRILE